MERWHNVQTMFIETTSVSLPKAKIKVERKKEGRGGKKQRFDPMFFSRTLSTKMRRFGKNWKRKATLQKEKQEREFRGKIKKKLNRR